MRTSSVWARVLGVDDTVVHSVWFDEVQQAVVAEVKPYSKKRNRCGVCGRRCPRYDNGAGTRRWRTLDLGTARAFLEGPSYRVQCPAHGVVVASVPWARHDVGFTRRFEETVAWLATHTDKTSVSTLMRVTWRTVGRIVERVAADSPRHASRFTKLRRIGIDEISYRKGHRYLIVVVDHDTGQLIWAAPGRDQKTLRGFFALLGEDACARIKEVSADAAKWIGNAVAACCPNATLCLDPFHIVAWATDALDEVRRDVWNKARREGQTAQAKELKGARFALWRNPEDLTQSQTRKLSAIQRTNGPLYRAYLLKEQLRCLLKLPAARAVFLLNEWLAWASRSRIPAFVKLGRCIRKHRAGIEATLTLRLSNGLVESMNTKIRLIARRAFGFHSPHAMIALAMLGLGGLCPPLPDRTRVATVRLS